MRKLQTKDVFSAVRLIKKLKIKEDFKEMLEIHADENRTSTEIGSEILFLVMERAAEQESEEAVYSFLAGPLEKTEDEIASMELMELISAVEQCADIEGWKNFLKHVSALGMK